MADLLPFDKKTQARKPKKKERGLTRKEERRLTKKEQFEKELEIYKLVTERARDIEGYIKCEHCGRSLLDGEEQRHHIVYRSQGGETTEQNVICICEICHKKEHFLKVPNVQQSFFINRDMGEEV